jgi:predicted nucleic acid binding AN1-type Zn finger protein
MMAKDESSDGEWLPPKTSKPKPKNFALLQARAKKNRSKTKVIFQCQHCPKYFQEKYQLKNHKRVHGRL